MEAQVHVAVSNNESGDMCFSTSFYTSRSSQSWWRGRPYTYSGPRIVTPCLYLIVNRVVVVLFEPWGHFLFLFLSFLRAEWVSVGHTWNNLQELAVFWHQNCNFCILEYLRRSYVVKESFNSCVSANAGTKPLLKYQGRTSTLSSAVFDKEWF